MRAMSVPPWIKWTVLAALQLAIAAFVWIQASEHEGQKLIDYQAGQLAQTVKIGKAQQVVIKHADIKYVDRIKTIYLKGEQIEKQVPIYVTTADSAHFAVNAGFVRITDAAWAGDAAGLASESDREPASVSLAEVAEATAFNATACRAWREKAIGIEATYKQLQQVTNTAAP